MKNKLGIVNRDMNFSGAATLFLIILQVAATLDVYYLLAVHSGARIGYYGASLSGALRTVADLRSAAALNPLAMPLALLAATLIGNIIPFAICAALTRVDLRTLFARPRVTAGTAAVYGVCAVGASLCVSFVVNLISTVLRLFHLQLTTPQIKIPTNSLPAAIAMIFAVVVVAPVTEEFIYRGVLLNIFKRYGSVFAVVGSSLVWALLHGNFVQGLPVFVMGLFFGTLALKARSILPTIVIHSLNNALSLFESTLAQNRNMVGLLAAALINFSLLAAAIALVATYHKTLFQLERGGSARGFAVFFTCIPVLIAILYCAVTTVFSIKPL